MQVKVYDNDWFVLIMVYRMRGEMQDTLSFVDLICLTLFAVL